MRKKLLILALFVFFSMSYKEKTKAESLDFHKTTVLKIQGEKPEIKTVYPSNIIDVAVGRDILFLARFTGTPKFTYKVYKNSKELENNPSKYKTELYENTVSVTIYKINKQDAGLYKIEISNNYGKDETTFKVNVTDRD